MCEDYPACGHDLNDCPEQSMEDFYGWSLEDDWEEEPLTPEEQLASDRAQAQVAQEEAIGEMYASRYAFD
jgi:hypothetical protein